jgi:hypothetical protein
MIRPLIVVCICAAMAACAARPRGEQAETAPPVALPPAPPPGEPNGIAGMDAQTLRVAFGEPAFVRKDGHAEMWRYDGANCKAFFFLYPSGTAMSVRHVETLPRGGVMAADSGCLDVLRVRRATTPVS